MRYDALAQVNIEQSSKVVGHRTRVDCSIQDYLNATQQFSSTSHTNYEEFVASFPFYHNLTERWVPPKVATVIMVAQCLRISFGYREGFFRRLEIYANVNRTPDTEIATTYYDYMTLYIDSLRDHQDKLRDDIL